MFQSSNQEKNSYPNLPTAYTESLKKEETKLLGTN